MIELRGGFAGPLVDTEHYEVELKLARQRQDRRQTVVPARAGLCRSSSRMVGLPEAAISPC